MRALAGGSLGRVSVLQRVQKAILSKLEEEHVGYLFFGLLPFSYMILCRYRYSYRLLYNNKSFYRMHP